MASQVETYVADVQSPEKTSGDLVMRDDSAEPVIESEVHVGLELSDLAQIIQTYNEVTEKLQHSHDLLGQEVVRLQAELAGKDAALQRSKRLAALGEMAAGIAHEIRNPLAAIHLYAQMLTDDLKAFQSECEVDGEGEAFSDQIETSTKIASAVRGLNAVVNDVLSFSREIKPRVKVVNARLLLERAIEAQYPAIDAAGVTIRRGDGLSTHDAMELNVDPDLMQQVIVNLIRNAVDAMRDCHRERILTLDVNVDGNLAVVAIKDNGEGIAKQAIDRIFNPFFTTRNTGTGLGLAIVHRIVDAHGGSIVVYNKNGAVFEVRLPRSIEAAGAAASHESELDSSECE